MQQQPRALPRCPTVDWGGEEILSACRALSARWTLPYLRACHPETQVDVSVSEDGVVCGTLTEHATLPMAFGRQLIAQIEAPEGGVQDGPWKRRASQLSYHLAQCPLSALPALARDAVLPRSAAREALGEATETNLWLAIGEARSTLHYDSYDNLMLVLRGTKRLLLFPPSATRHLGPRPAHAPSANHSTLSAEQIAELEARLGGHEGGGALRLEVPAGHSVFIPEGWWHEVESPEEVTVAVNFWWNGATHAAVLSTPAPSRGMAGTPLAGAGAAHLLRRAFEAAVDAQRRRMLARALSAASSAPDDSEASRVLSQYEYTRCACGAEGGGAAPTGGDEAARGRARLLRACAEADAIALLREALPLRGTDVTAALASAAEHCRIKQDAGQI